MSRPELLFNHMTYDYKVVNEDSEIGGVKTKRLKGPLSEGDVENRNKRRYPKYLLEREVERLMPDILERNVIGELDHPDDLKIHLDKVSHVVTEAYWEGNKLMGTIEILPQTEAGRNLLGLINGGVKLGISSRGVGSVGPDGVVQEDLRLITWDVVAQPSNYSSWLSLTESYKPIYLDELGVDPQVAIQQAAKQQAQFRGLSLDEILSRNLKKI